MFICPRLALEFSFGTHCFCSLKRGNKKILKTVIIYSNRLLDYCTKQGETLSIDIHQAKPAKFARGVLSKK
jgi:hypothetical protein